MAKKWTIREIAEKAGVSKATVSRVLNASASVNPATREAVMDVIRKYDYSPSSMARILSRSESDMVGVLIPEIENPFFGEILKVVSDTIVQNDLTMICFNSGNQRENDEKALINMRDYRIKGLIYTPAVDYSQSPADLQRIKKLLNDLDAPVVFLDRRIEGLPNTEGVYFNNYKAAYLAVQRMAEAGHTRIGILNAGLERVLARERQNGYLDALRDCGLAAEERYMFFGDYSVERAYELSLQCLQMEDRPTAMLTCNNFTSIGFLKAVTQAGLTLHRDITCIGFDRLDILDELGLPFNYIERNIRAMGETVIEKLTSRIAFPQKAFQDCIIDPELIIRKL